MEKSKVYELPKLPYGYGDLSPYISEEQLRIHHTKHHQAYISGANALIEKLDKARKKGVDLDMKAVSKEMSFHLAGDALHSAFWLNLAPPGKGGGGKPDGAIGVAIVKEYGSFDRFKKEFSQIAVSVEGSGWAALTYCGATDRISVMQIEKHNVNWPPDFPVLTALDVWEHAYYLDYKNERARFVDAFWSIVDWQVVDKWFKHAREYMQA